MDNKLIVRKIRKQDIPGMTDARLDYLTGMQGERPAAYKEELRNKLLDYFTASIGEGTFFALVAELDGQAVSYGGMILKTIPGDFHASSYLEGDILNMYTLPEYRRRGYSSIILEQLLKEAKTMGVSKVALHCSKEGEPLYRKYGFTDPIFPYLELII